MTRTFRNYLAPLALLTGIFMAVSFLHPVKVAAVATTCGYNGNANFSYVGAEIQVEIVDSNGNHVAWSNSFKFTVTAGAAKTGNPSSYNPSPDSGYATQYWPINDLNSAIQGPGRAPLGPSQAESASSNTHSCGGIPTYDFTDGSNGNDILDCLGGDVHGAYSGPTRSGYTAYYDGSTWHNNAASANFTFTPTAPGAGYTMADGSFSASWKIVPNASTDLNKATRLHTFVFKLAPADAPPTGSITLSCNANGTGTATGSIGDPDGSTTGKISVAAGSPSFSKSLANGAYTVTIPAANASSGTWTAVLLVYDSGGSNDLTKSASHATCNKPPTGSMVGLSCKSVQITGVSDQNTPASAITYYLSVNGGTAQSAVWTQGNPALTVDVSGYNGFNPWAASNSVALSAKDVQNGTVYAITSVSLAGPCGSVSCGTSTLGTTATVGITENFTVNMNYTGATNPPPGATFNINITGPSNVSFPNVPATATSSSPVVSNSRSFTPASGGSYTLTWTYFGKTCTQGTPTQVGYSPYFSVLGGDTAAGPGFGTTCSTGVNSSISGTNLDDGSGTSFYGAGTDRAAFASGDITSFATSQTPLGTDASSGGLIPKGLSFANSLAGGTKYGNDFQRPNWCMPDYTTAKTVTTGAVDLSSAGTRTYKVSGPYIMGAQLLPIPGLGYPTTIGKGAHVTVIVNGDAYLTGDILYAAYNGVGDTVNDIPQFKLVVTGNVYIINTVQELHGFYAAQPSGGSGGHVNTCTSVINGLGNALSGLTSINILTDANYYNECNHKLSIYGGVAAKKLDLERTWGNLAASGGVPAEPAEQFVFTPELWLGNLQGPSDSTEPVQAFTSLPPNL